MGTANENKAYNRAVVVSEGVARTITDGEQDGTGVSKTTLRLKATYVAMGFDFNDTWEIQETECYPYMKTQTAPPVIQSQVISGATTVSGKCVDGGTITLEVDGTKQQMVSTSNTFSFTVSPLQAGHEVRLSAKAEGKQQSYYTTETVTYLGKGTEADPYQVYTAADLTGVYRKGYFKLMNNIDLTSYINQFSPTEGWQSIGRDGSETIHFDGNGHMITGLWCNTTRDNTGLFSCFANGTIKNLTVVTATGKQVKGGANTGILIGKMMNGTIENCSVTGTVADGTPVGGIVGLLSGGSITRCLANVTIATTGATSYVGGLVGEITSGTINECVTQGTLTATGATSYVGGLVGKNSATITNSYSTAAVSSSYNAAGLVAYNYGAISNCYAAGNIQSMNYGAGVVGYNDGSSATVSRCVAMNDKIEVTYESQQVQQGGGYGQRIIGGIKNSAPEPEMNNYALKTMQVSVNNVAQKVYDDMMNGTAKTGDELMQTTTYQSNGWDMTNTWKLTEGESYPWLVNNVASVGGAATAVTITAKSYTVQYGEALPTFGYTSTGASLSGTPQLTCEATSTSAVGTYTIVVSRGSVTNENVSYENGTLTITKAPLTISAGNYRRAVGEANPTFTLTYDGFKNSETASVLTKQAQVTTTATANSAVGQYKVSVSGAEAVNYDITYVDGLLTVTQLPTDTENMLTISNLTVTRGDAVNLPIAMTNTANITAFQFELVLPAGVTITKRTLSNRKDDHSMGFSQLANGNYQFTAFSSNSMAFSGNSGTLLDVELTTEQTMTAGDHIIEVKNVVLTDVDGTQYLPADCSAILTVNSVRLGDANGDGTINITDAVGIVNYILGKPAANFKLAAADVNKDGTVNITDAVGVVNHILGRITLSSRRKESAVREPQ